MTARNILERAGCEMRVTCDRDWDAFEVTEEEGIRFCSHCEKAVFLTQTPTELRIAAERGLCVYIKPGSPAVDVRATYTLTRERIRNIEARNIIKNSGLTGSIMIKDE